MIHRTYVINLARRCDKRTHMIQEFAKLSENRIELSHVFYDAIDGNNIEHLSQFKFKIPNWFDPNSGKAMTNGEVGCALSHYAIWLEIVKSVDSGSLEKNCKVLILEDDVMFVDNFMEKYRIYENEIKDDYDMFYLHRKPLNIDAEERVGVHIRRPKKSYWTCAYILSYQGAKKLINAKYLDNLIPVDEFLPIMYGCNIYGFEKLFEQYEKLSCYAAYPSLLKLTSNAFNDSETFHSKPYQLSDKFIFDTDKEFSIIYIGPTNGDSFARFIEYCELYSLPRIILDSINMPDISTIHKKLAEIDNLEDKLFVVISVLPNDNCNFIPTAPPTEIINKFNSICHNKNGIIIPNGETSKTIFCGWGNRIQRMIQDYLDKVDIVKNITNAALSTAIMFNTFITSDIIKDDTCQIFCCVNSEDDIIYNTTKSKISHKKFGTTPSILFSNEIGNLVLNRIQNYTGNNWNEYYGYRNHTEPKTILPTVYISILSDKNPSVVDIIQTIDYPRELLTVVITKGTINDNYYQEDLEKYIATNCEYYFFINHDCILVNPNVLKELINLNKKIIAPLIRRGDESWTNFWGDLDKNGYYKRSHDYFDIINGERRGCWNVPHVFGTYLIHRSVIESVPDMFTKNTDIDADMRMCHNIRQHDIHIYLSNLNSYGYIQTELQIAPEIDINKEVTVFDFSTRRSEWEKKYLHPEYFLNKNNLKHLRCTELCNDVFNFPLFSREFCSELIQTMEKYGKWSGGAGHNIDHRLGHNYYENVPTQDIQLFEVGLDKHWESIVNEYIAPLVRIVYSNYKTKSVHLAFVVRYHWQQQSELQEHHDASTYTINIALNEGGGKDYEGGGSRFIRQNYSSINQEIGTANLHPGKCTHYHKGLKTTAGIRYILVSFIN
ncbi:putative procollagen-lysine 2-oxoglutarate 5-dioxygenase [Megavirus courdo11]|uniref:procollagen-lysine 5-dioxygenase n=1 Tax=Megavirus courdo11 TaxID=1128140 RepID=K7YEL3_9VIRU|nr:putative procollagen-lysine 2-oxoglutarate 5-dioxygenase [Megavirus courdo11]